MNKTPDEAQAYFTELFETAFDAGPRRLLQLRAEFLGHATGSPDEPGDDPLELVTKRQDVEQRIREIRRSFWTMELGALRKRLSRLDGDGFPDLIDAIDKLKHAARHRAQFPKLVQHRCFHPELFSVFKQVVILSAREAAPHKEKLAVKLRREGNRKPYVAMIRGMREHFPELFQLEREWFELIEWG